MAMEITLECFTQSIHENGLGVQNLEHIINGMSMKCGGPLGLGFHYRGHASLWFDNWEGLGVLHCNPSYDVSLNQAWNGTGWNFDEIQAACPDINLT
ncbi:hypothetical protein ACH5RR_012938 [Cinchona calisaya]|uniref:Uncharacterized protein n=1 Tax=Cinchona calisaya TaxID=153742 RepID=A0ABD2ZYN1_9GENT